MLRTSAGVPGLGKALRWGEAESLEAWREALALKQSLEEEVRERESSIGRFQARE